MDTDSKSVLARQLFNSRSYGILSTLSKEIDGYPFGSVTPYVVDKYGHPIVLISELAQHTKNISANPKVSLTVIEGDKGGDIQAYGRVTYIGNAEMIAKDSDSAKRYLRYYPGANRYFDAHNFNFYKISFVRGRYIGGFGKIFWLEEGEFVQENPFSEEEELEIIGHMNKDHNETMRKYFHEQLKKNPVLMGVDKEGCDITVGKERYRFTFNHPISSDYDIKTALTELMKN